MQKTKWKQINWDQVETYINRLQIRIVKAVQENKWRLVRRLQYLITHSFYGKALAVKRVISNKGKNTPGIDVLWSSIFVTLMANKIGGLQFGIYRNCQISSRVFHTAVAALPLTKANRSDFE